MVIRADKKSFKIYPYLRKDILNNPPSLSKISIKPDHMELAATSMSRKDLKKKKFSTNINRTTGRNGVRSKRMRIRFFEIRKTMMIAW